MDDGTEEHWRPVPGYEGLYEVSDQGRARSLPRKGGKNRTYGGSTLKGAPGPDGYPAVALCRGGQCETRRMHNLVMEAFAGPPPPGMLVRHLDDNPEDNRLENLAYGTPAENGADAVRHGRNVQANQTHCVNGHPFDEENTLRVNGRRKCRRCHMLVIWRKRNKEPDSPPRKRAPKTRCPRGHEYTPENTYTSPDGRRQCRACIRLRQERRKAA